MKMGAFPDRGYKNINYLLYTPQGLFLDDELSFFCVFWVCRVLLAV